MNPRGRPHIVPHHDAPDGAGTIRRGVAHHDEAAGARLLAELERIKWLLWHGNQHRARTSIGDLEEDVDGLEIDYPNLRKFAKSAHEFAVYIRTNTGSLINYGERFRAGERISSCLAEWCGKLKAGPARRPPATLVPWGTPKPLVCTPETMKQTA